MADWLQSGVWLSDVSVDTTGIFVFVCRKTEPLEKMLLWLLVVGPALLANGFYLPGLAPVSFCEPGNHEVPDCKVNTTRHNTIQHNKALLWCYSVFEYWNIQLSHLNINTKK